MQDFLYLIKRNIKVYFNDKGLFFTSLITPLILLILYATFLANIFEESFLSMIPKELNVSNSIIKALVSGQLMSSLLAVSCITVAFSSNMLMVQDKINGTIKDLNVSPIKKSKIVLSYFVSTFISGIIVNLAAIVLCLIYTYFRGWYYSFSDIMYLLLDVLLLTLFGCSLSSVINSNLKSQGQVSAVSAIVSSTYGFLCGAYMPISSFGTGLQKVLSFLPGTYATSLIRNHSMNPIFNQIKNIDSSIIDEIKKGVDCLIEFNGNAVSILNMYLVLTLSIIILIIIYLLISRMNKNKH